MKRYSKEHIAQLLERFMDGTSTLEEEDVLASYVREERQLPKEWEAFREMFAIFDAEQSREIVVSPSSPKKHAFRLWFGFIAAAIAVLAVVGFRIWKNDKNVKVIVENPVNEVNPLPLQQHPQPQTEMKLAVFPREENVVNHTEPTEVVKNRHKTKESSMEAEEAIRLLAEENAKLKSQLDSAQRELEEVRQQVLIAEMQAYGYIPVYQEDGSVQFILATQPYEVVEM